MKTIVIGLGNPILGDDGAGWKVAEEVKKLLPLPPASSTLGQDAKRLDQQFRSARVEEGGEVEVEFLSLGGISLMEHLIGYERAILIDAVSSDQETGSVIVSKLSEIPDYSAFHTTSAHDTSLQNALKLGKAMGANLPEDVTVVGIATNHIYDFSEELSPPVEQAIPKATKIVISLLA
ncbi:MAG TPA: hydrogenase maturation protease [Anaerolineales bacterium]|nr:hydrogenase maturation protease [Anaerolineales bacterium]